MLWLRFRLADSRGQILWFLEHSIAIKANLKRYFEGETLQVLEKMVWKRNLDSFLDL